MTQHLSDAATETVTESLTQALGGGPATWLWLFLLALAIASVARVLRDRARRRLRLEAIEPQEGGMLSGQFIIGTQWHPEFGASKMSERIVSQVVDHARQFAQAQQQEASPRPSMAAQFRQRSAPQQLAL